MKKYITLLITCFLLLILKTYKSQDIYLSAASGNWNTLATWNQIQFFPVFNIGPATSIPNAGDQVNVQDNHTITVTAPESCALINMASTNNPSNLNINTGSSITCDSITMNPNAVGTCNITNNGNITVLKINLNTSASGVSCGINNNGIMVVTNTNFFHTAGGSSINLNSGSRYTTNIITATNTSVAGTRIDLSSGNGILRLNGDIAGPSLITISGGNAGSRIEYRGAAAQTIQVSNPNFQAHDIRVSNTAGASLDAPITLTNVTGELRTTGSGIINQAGFDINLPERVFVSTNGTFNSNANITVGTNLVNQGTFNQSAGTITTTINLSNTGTFNKTGGDIITGTTFVNGSTSNSSSTFNQSAGNITVGTNLTNRAIINQNNGAMNIGGVFNNFLTYNANGTIDITRNFVNQAAGTFTSTGCNINVERNWTNNGTYTYATGDIVTLDGVGGNSAFAGTTEFYELNVNKTGRNAIAGNDDIITIRSILDVDAGNFNVTGTGSVTLLSDASGTAQLDELETGANFNGNLTVQRFLGMSNDGWRELTSPVSGTTLADWQDDGIILTGFPGADFDGSNWYAWINSYTYEQANANGVKDDGWVSATSNTNPTTFTNGHRIYIGTGSNTLSVTGNPIKKVQAATITNAGTASDDQNGWNLIGNPYPCTIDWNSVTKSNAEDAIWIFNATAGNYGIYQGGDASGTNGVDNNIAHSQAFWVHGTGGTGTIFFQESNKVRTDKAFVKSVTSDEFVRIKLTGNVNSFYDEAVLTFNDEATENFDFGIDRNKLYTHLNDVAPSLAIKTADNVDLSIAGLNEYKSYNVNLKAYAGTNAYGNYTIDFNFPENSLINHCITLEDLETGTITDLKVSPSYNFNTTANSPEERFIIHFTTPFETEVVSPSCNALTDGKIKLEGSNINGNTFTLSNSQGNIMSLVGSSNELSFENLVAGQYTITSSQASSCGTSEMIVNLTEPSVLTADFKVEDDVVYIGYNNTIDFENKSNGTENNWNFGDGTTSSEENPTHVFQNPGFYIVTLITTNGNCEETYSKTIEVRTATSVKEEEENSIFNLVNTDGLLTVTLLNNTNKETVRITTLDGSLIFNSTFNSNTIGIDTKAYAKGIYLVTITNENSSKTEKVFIQ